MNSTTSKDRLVQSALKDLSTVGYHRTNVYKILGGADMNLFGENLAFFKKMRSDPFIQGELDIISRNFYERSARSRNKPFQITHFHFLKRPLSLDDGLFIMFHLHDFFTSVACAFLETPTPYLFNVHAWIHAWGKGRNRLHSQIWHRDREDYKLLKIFTYYTDIGPRNGPLEYVPKSFCGGDFPTYKGRDAYMDYSGSSSQNNGAPRGPEEISLCESTYVSLTGKKGDIILSNNSGFHRGGFVEEGLRCMSHALYIRPTAELIKNGYFSSFNYDSTINHIDFGSRGFNSLGEKQKYFLKP